MASSEKQQYMSRNEVLNFKPYPLKKPQDINDSMKRTRDRMKLCGQWKKNQVLGLRSTIGCVALEITQRCNLDCTLCYLSENSESVKDIPMEEIHRRIDQILWSYGPDTNVQVTGGDPTLRKREELVEIIRTIRQKGMNPTLMTNGIKATRDLLLELVDAGLNDVAFHVDLTQERKGYTTEVSLNELREKYIERVRGLPIAVVFNTTVFEGNFKELPDLIRFFKKHADVVGMASFQLQADTGRGELRERNHQLITLDTVTSQIQKGAGAKISFDTVQIGHPECHRYGLTAVCDDKTIDIWDDAQLFIDVIHETEELQLKRNKPHQVVLDAFAYVMKHPKLVSSGLKLILPKLWAAKGGLIKGKKMHKQTYFCQNFMDAKSLVSERVHACSFMVMTAQGPISMCMHNAKRDEYILEKLRVKTDKGEKVWDPLSGKVIDESVKNENAKISEPAVTVQ